uniref:Uncharacterized protein n=1 Tax=Rhizophora mucronata TaxID=61149 RepID=A0A2P2PVB5_RHIMU
MPKELPTSLVPQHLPALTFYNYNFSFTILPESINISSLYRRIEQT